MVGIQIDFPRHVVNQPLSHGQAGFIECIPLICRYDNKGTLLANVLRVLPPWRGAESSKDEFWLVIPSRRGGYWILTFSLQIEQTDFNVVYYRLYAVEPLISR